MLSYQANKEWLHKLMDLLEAHFGPDVEFVLHDLTLDYEHTIVDIRNGHITGREIGGTGDILGLEYIRNASEDNGTYYNFIEYTKEGKTLRSSTMFIKHNSKLVGMLCINFDDSRYLAASENVLRLCHPDIFIDDHIAPQQAEPGDPFPRAVPATTESFHNSIDAVAGDAVGRELIRLGVTADRLTPDERMQIIASLENGGIFLLKGAVKDVADALHCSQASVYRYLSQIKKDDSNSASE